VGFGQHVKNAETFCFAEQKSLFQLIKNAAGSIQLIKGNGLLDQHLLPNDTFTSLGDKLLAVLQVFFRATPHPPPTSALAVWMQSLMTKSAAVANLD
jgi:hypothetical protein